MAKAVSLTLDVRPGEAKQQRGPGFLHTALGSPGTERTKESEEIRTYRKGWWSPQVGNEDILTQRRKKKILVAVPHSPNAHQACHTSAHTPDAQDQSPSYSNKGLKAVYQPHKPLLP